MSESTVQQLLGRYLFDQGHSPICGNFQTATLPECDLISVNKDGYLCEWEIKLTRSDFKADQRKERKHHCLAEGQGLLARRRGGELEYHFLTCSYFSYACPPGLLYPSDVPAYAGLVWVAPDGRVSVQQAPPLRHAHKADARILRRINHNLTQKYLFGCSRSTFATRQPEAPKQVVVPLLTATPPPAKGRRIKPRDPVPVRRRRRR